MNANRFRGLGKQVAISIREAIGKVAGDSKTKETADKTAVKSEDNGKYIDDKAPAAAR